MQTTGIEMTRYHAKFCILGDVAEMLIPESENTRLLIDISARPEVGQPVPDFAYRTSFCVIDPGLIEDIQERVSLGDVIEATGSFWQTGYVPHRTTYIDTTFCLTGYRLIEKRTTPVVRYGPWCNRFPASVLH